MKARYSVSLALAAALAGCSGGSGGSSGAPVAPINGPVVPSTATFPLSITIPKRTVAPSGRDRAPQYVSAGTQSVAVYESTTLIFVGNFNVNSVPQFTTVYAKSGPTTVTDGSCTASASSSTCTMTIQTTVGAHVFDVLTYPVSQGSQASSAQRSAQDFGTVPTFHGVILSQGELSVSLNPGTNPGQTITLLGVASQATFAGPSPALTFHLNGTGPLVGIVGTQYTYQYSINDSAGLQIIQPGNYDDGPVTVSETDGNAILTMTAVSTSTPPAAAGTLTLTVTCAKAGVATITAGSASHPTATYASGLTYNASNYSNGTLGSTTLQCADNSATLPVTVQ
ncbi:MAG TPA: hypothetical protein VGC96_13845 [Candidatus Elarobacter sp.]|jgi:hypothetical protein